MKRFLFACCILVCSMMALPAFAGITWNYPVVTNNSTITFTAQGEGATNGYICTSSLASYVITVAQLSGDNPPPYGTGDGDFSDYFYVTGPTVTAYNCTTHTPTQIQFVVHRYNIANVNFDISFHFQLVTSTTCGGTCTGTPVDSAPTATVFPYGEFGNSAIARNFTRNNCGTGYTGSSVFESIPINTYASTISQADADNQATTAAQNAANASGTCTPNPITFPINNSSGEGLSITFSTPGQSNVNKVVAAHTNSSVSLIPGLSYSVTCSPSGSPVNCTMQFISYGPTYGPAPGHTFTGVLIGGTGGNTSFSIY
jgi:uncharacterized protein DUF5977